MHNHKDDGMSLINDIKTLRQDRAKLVADAGKILTAASKEKRDLTNEENGTWEKMHADAEALNPRIERLERQLNADASVSTTDGNPPVGREDRDPKTERASEIDPERAEELKNKAFRSWCMYGYSGLNQDERRAFSASMSPVTSDMLAAMPDEARAQSVGTGSAGGVTVPQGFQRSIETAQLQFSGMLEASTILDTATGADLPMPTSDDTGNIGVLLAENTQDAEQDVTFGSVTLQAFMGTSKIVRVSIQLMQDSAFDLNAWLGERLGERLGRLVNNKATVGTGSSQPNGVVVASTLGVTAASNSAITFNELLDLKHSVDPAYRRSPKAGWMFNDSTLKAIKKLVDSQNRPLWQANLALNEPETIDGDRFFINQDMASIATVAKTVLYGDFSKYIIRRVTPVQLMRLNERYADFLQVAFLAFQRFDSDLLDAGTNPIKHLIQAV